MSGTIIRDGDGSFAAFIPEGSEEEIAEVVGGTATIDEAYGVETVGVRRFSLMPGPTDELDHFQDMRVIARVIDTEPGATVTRRVLMVDDRKRHSARDLDGLSRVVEGGIGLLPGEAVIVLTCEAEDREALIRWLASNLPERFNEPTEQDLPQNAAELVALVEGEHPTG